MCLKICSFGCWFLGQMLTCSTLTVSFFGTIPLAMFDFLGRVLALAAPTAKNVIIHNVNCTMYISCSTRLWWYIHPSLSPSVSPFSTLTSLRSTWITCVFSWRMTAKQRPFQPSGHLCPSKNPGKRTSNCSSFRWINQSNLKHKNPLPFLGAAAPL